MSFREWMSRRDLKLRPMPRVILGYVVAPLAGLIAFGLVGSVYASVLGAGLSAGLNSLIPIVVLGMVPAMIGEALIATPSLLAFRFLRRTWPSTWIISAVGVATGEVPLLTAGVWDGIATGFPIHNVQEVDTLFFLLVPGAIVGFVAALAFRATAFETDSGTAH